MSAAAKQWSKERQSVLDAATRLAGTMAEVAKVDVGCDRDDWQLPDVADGHEHRLLWAIDDAIEAWHRDNEWECRRIERVWAGAVSW